MTLQRFAEKFKLRISRDECGDSVVRGSRGHLYFDGGKLCLMILDGRPILRTRLDALGGTLWTGDISLNAQGKRVQDAKIQGIPEENTRVAARIAGCRTKRVMSPAQRAVLEKALRANPLIPIRALQDGPLLA